MLLLRANYWQDAINQHLLNSRPCFWSDFESSALLLIQFCFGQDGCISDGEDKKRHNPAYLGEANP